MALCLARPTGTNHNKSQAFGLARSPNSNRRQNTRPWPSSMAFCHAAERVRSCAVGAPLVQPRCHLGRSHAAHEVHQAHEVLHTLALDPVFATPQAQRQLAAALEGMARVPRRTRPRHRLGPALALEQRLSLVLGVVFPWANRQGMNILPLGDWAIERLSDWVDGPHASWRLQTKLGLEHGWMSLRCLFQSWSSRFFAQGPT